MHDSGGAMLANGILIGCGYLCFDVLVSYHGTQIDSCYLLDNSHHANESTRGSRSPDWVGVYAVVGLLVPSAAFQNDT